MSGLADPRLVTGENTYVCHDEANVVLAERLFSGAWFRDDAQRTAALTTATAILDRMKWAGRPKSAHQALAWPRTGMRDAHGVPLPADLIPQPVITACVELAAHLLTAGAMSSSPVQMRMLGDSMTTYFPSTPDELPKHVRRLIEPFLRAGSVHSAEIAF